MNYCELLFNIEENYSDCTALIDGENGKKISYGQLKNEVLKTAYMLSNKGYGKGTVILTHLYNSIETALILLAVQYIGGVIVLVDPLFKYDELNYYIDDSRANCVITHMDIINYEKNSSFDIFSINGFMRELSGVEDYLILNEEGYYNYQENELAMLLYTSGSTSTPKGVMLSTECFFTFLEKSNISMYRYNSNDRILCFVPFSHGYGSISILIPVLFGRAAIVFLRSFQPIKIGKIILAENITHIFGVPTHYQQLLRYKDMYNVLKKLKAAFSAAAPLSYETALNWYNATGLYLDEGYGMTENGTLISTRLGMLPEPSGNVGFPPEGVLIMEAVDENGVKCGDGIIGELRLKGKGIMLGYFDRFEETAEVLKDGWLYTGDFGYRRNDGSFVICGRKKEFINVAGLKFSPLEVEAVLNSHKDVVDSAVIGIEDRVYGEVVKAFVVLKDSALLKERELIKYVANKLASFKIPKYIVFLDEFPRNNIGKIDKKVLKSMEVKE